MIFQHRDFIFLHILYYIILVSVLELYAIIIQDAAEWTPTFLKVTGKGVVGVGRRGRWQQFGRIV